MTRQFPSIAIPTQLLDDHKHHITSSQLINTLFKISSIDMNWTGGRLRRHSGPNDKTHKQVFKRPTTASKGPHQITLFNGLAKAQDTERRGGREREGGSSNAASQMVC
jgi:hypothetical protein